MTRAGPGPCHLSRCYLQREWPRSAPGGSSRNSGTGRRCSCQEPFPSPQGWGGGGRVLQELGWIVQPNLSFGVTLGCPENPGRTRSGSKEGCLGWWHGRERSLEKPLSSLVVEESLRTAQVPACLRSRKLGCESPILFSRGFIQWLFGMIWERATAAGPGGTAPALRVGKMFLLAFHFLTEFHPSQRSAAWMSPWSSLFPASLPNNSLQALSKEESIPQHARRSHCTSLLCLDAQGDPPNKKKKHLGKKAKEPGRKNSWICSADL